MKLKCMLNCTQSNGCYWRSSDGHCTYKGYKICKIPLNKRTFKQELTLEAEQLASNIGISEDVERIKQEMKKCVEYRSYTVSLIKAHTTMAIGSNSSNMTHLFIPKLVSPQYYRKLFVDELMKLGFTEECMELYVQETSSCDYYNIKLTW